MSPTPQFRFGPFRLDPNDAGLWRGTQAPALTPKAFAVLQYLLEHARELVTTGALFAAVWHDAVVRLVHAIHQQTDGHPFFLVAMADDAVRRGSLTEVNGRWEVQAGRRQSPRMCWRVCDR